MYPLLLSTLFSLKRIKEDRGHRNIFTSLSRSKQEREKRKLHETVVKQLREIVNGKCGGQDGAFRDCKPQCGFRATCHCVLFKLYCYAVACRIIEQRELIRSFWVNVAICFVIWKTNFLFFAKAMFSNVSTLKVSSKIFFVCKAISLFHRQLPQVSLPGLCRHLVDAVTTFAALLALLTDDFINVIVSINHLQLHSL